jgi:hypothetical protein
MAANVQKYKVANMAKDLDKKTKEIVEVLKEKGFDKCYYYKNRKPVEYEI